MTWQRLKATRAIRSFGCPTLVALGLVGCVSDRTPADSPPQHVIDRVQLVDGNVPSGCEYVTSFRLDSTTARPDIVRQRAASEGANLVDIRNEDLDRINAAGAYKPRRDVRDTTPDTMPSQAPPDLESRGDVIAQAFRCPSGVVDVDQDVEPLPPEPG